jgi:hypothetical protein
MEEQQRHDEYSVAGCDDFQPALRMRGRSVPYWLFSIVAQRERVDVHIVRLLPHLLGDYPSRSAIARFRRPPRARGLQRSRLHARDLD